MGRRREARGLRIFTVPRKRKDGVEETILAFHFASWKNCVFEKIKKWTGKHGETRGVACLLELLL